MHCVNILCNTVISDNIICWTLSHLYWIFCNYYLTCAFTLCAQPHSFRSCFGCLVLGLRQDYFALHPTHPGQLQHGLLGKKMKGNRRLGVRAWWWERNETHSQRLLTSSSQIKRARKLRTARLWRTRAYLTWNEALCPELKVDRRKWNRSNSVKRQVWSAGCFKNNYILI